MHRRICGVWLCFCFSLFLWIFYILRLEQGIGGLNQPKIDKYRPSFVYSDCDGRLGNQISTFASLFIFHKMYGFTPYLHQHQLDLLSRYFQNNTFDLYRENIPKNFDKIQLEYKFDKLKNISLNVYNRLAINIGNYPHSLDLYREHLAEINQQLKLRKEYKDEANEILFEIAKNYTGSNLTFIGIHVRRADYQNYMNKKLGKHIEYVNETYFLNGINEFKKQFSNPRVAVFIAVSDEEDWIEEHLGDQENVFIGGKVLQSGTKDSSARDFALLCQCNHSLLSYGSFGQWTALRAGGHTILPMETKRLSHIMLDPGAAFKNNITNWTFI